VTFDDRDRPDPRHSLADLEPSLRERLAALDEPVSWADWPGVARRRAHRLGTRLATLVGVTLAVAVAAFSTVWIVAGQSLRAPTTGAARAFGRFALGEPPIGPRAIPSDTRVIAWAHLHGSESTLYVSPARGGGFCFEWTGAAAASCVRLTASLFSLAWGRPHLVIGTVSSPQISSVRIQFTDGTTAEPRVSWVSAPINAGFYLYDIPPGKAVATISML
jgi:hypothetical protein